MSFKMPCWSRYSVCLLHPLEERHGKISRPLSPGGGHASRRLLQRRWCGYRPACQSVVQVRKIIVQATLHIGVVLCYIRGILYMECRFPPRAQVFGCLVQTTAGKDRPRQTSSFQVLHGLCCFLVPLHLRVRVSQLEDELWDCCAHIRSVDVVLFPSRAAVSTVLLTLIFIASSISRVLSYCLSARKFLAMCTSMHGIKHHGENIDIDTRTTVDSAVDLQYYCCTWTFTSISISFTRLHRE